MRTLYLSALLCITLTGCLDLAPKADKLAEVNAKVTGLESKIGKITGIEASVDTKIDAKGNELTAKLLDLQSNVSQQIGSVKGQVNTGMFSGGAVYVTVVCVTLLLCMFALAAYLFYSYSRWRGAFRALKETVHEDSPNGTRDLRGDLEQKMKGKGFGSFLDKA